jgi:hypothetical protein
MKQALEELPEIEAAKAQQKREPSKENPARTGLKKYCLCDGLS